MLKSDAAEESSASTSDTGICVTTIAVTKSSVPISFLMRFLIRFPLGIYVPYAFAAVFLSFFKNRMIDRQASPSDKNHFG